MAGCCGVRTKGMLDHSLFSREVLTGKAGHQAFLCQNQDPAARFHISAEAAARPPICFFS